MEDISAADIISTTLCKFVSSPIITQPLVFPQDRSGYVPTQSDISSIQNIISLSDEVERNVALRLQEIRKFNALQRSLLAPIRRLSEDVLVEIFRLLVSNPIEIGTREGHIWNLWRVSVYWREVLERTPQLWNKFQVGRRDIKPETIARRIDWCLKFSGTAPLSISLHPPSDSVLPLLAVENIARHANRLLYFSVGDDIICRASEETNTQEIIEECGLAQLRTLILKDRGWPMDTYRIFWTATGLEDLKMKGQDIDYLLDMPWKRIKRLTMKSCHVRGADLISVLKMCLARELTWIGNTMWSEPTPGGEVTALPLLHTLNVSTSDKKVWLWSSLSVPRLANFCARKYRHINDLLLMIEKSGSIVKNLHMDGYADEDMIQAISQLRDVEKLSLRMTRRHSTEILTYLSRAAYPDVLPLLHDLRIEVPLEGFSYAIETCLVEEVMASRSRTLSGPVDKPESPSLVHLSYIKLRMDVPQDYYEHYVFPRHLCWIANVDFKKRLVNDETDDDTDDDDDENEEETDDSEVEEVDAIPDDENDGMVWW
ncbi:hypothetical protein BDQ17DRAFT_1367236 [Cyathus striatus]|nr:hypothetical protein BDQ17DRAFT_1367236 [Cyathus striatus]